MYYPKPTIIGPTPPKGSDVWWRAEDKWYANYDPFAEFEQPSGSHLVIQLRPYIVTKYTPKGVWLQDWMGCVFFQLGNALRQTAVPTKEAALFDLTKRKEKQLRIMEARAEAVRNALVAAEVCYEIENNDC